MFKLDLSPTYWWPVELLQVAGDGTVSSISIDVLFTRLSVEQESELLQEVAEQKMADPAVARRIMQGWRKVADAHDTELPWTEANRDALLAVPGAATAVVGAFFLSRNQAALGNLMRSRAAGPEAATTANPPTLRH